MLRIPTRRLLAAAAATAVTAVATVVAGAAPAHAAASGQILVKGTGSTYSANNGVNLGVIPGNGTKSWSFKVVNTSGTAAQFKVELELFGSGFTATLYNGYKAVAAPFTTGVILPGKSTVLTLKMAVNAGQPQNEYVAGVNLRDPLTNDLLDASFADANATYQTGTTQHDLFLKTGSQPFVGGSASQFLSSSAIRVGQSAQFTIRLKNDGATPAAITLHGYSGFACPDNFVWSVKQGTKNVTNAVFDGSYSTGVLARGAKKELKFSLKLFTLTNDPTCTSDYFYFEATGPDGSIGSAAHVLIAA